MTDNEIVKAKIETIKEFADRFEKRCIDKGLYPVCIKAWLNGVKEEMIEEAEKGKLNNKVVPNNEM